MWNLPRLTESHTALLCPDSFCCARWNLTAAYREAVDFTLKTSFPPEVCYSLLTLSTSVIVQPRPPAAPTPSLRFSSCYPSELPYEERSHGNGLCRGSACLAMANNNNGDNNSLLSFQPLIIALALMNAGDLRLKKNFTHFISFIHPLAI